MAEGGCDTRPAPLHRLSILALARFYVPILDLHLSTRAVKSVAGPLTRLNPELQAEFVRVLTFEFERHWEPIGDYTAPEVDPLLDMLEHMDVSVLTHFKFLCYPFQGGILALRIKAFRNLRHLSLPFFGDDKLMSVVGNNCEHLEEVDVWHSVLVTDKGIARFCLKKCVYTRNLWAKALKGIRSLHLSAVRSQYESLSSGRKSRKWLQQAYEENELNICLKKLSLVDLRDTSVTKDGLQFLQKYLKEDCQVLFGPKRM